MQRVVIDANVFVSLLTGRHEKQHTAARALLQDAEDGKIRAILPQFVVFEITYVLQSLYDVTGERLSSMVRDVVSFPGVQTVDDCSWSRIFEIWPDRLAGLADAAIVAVAQANRYEAVATFDRKLTNRLESFGLAPYW
ncbi:MAG TPA: PIN domain-containing protein [Thermoanaerobaculia bacterium]|nr:PIN domain-containing protein [Thermoanaerobaculia bacterium]